MGYLLDTTAISEVFRRKPNRPFVDWLLAVPRKEQFTSTIVVGELLNGARLSPHPELWLQRYGSEVFPRMTPLPFDMKCAERYGEVRAALMMAGTPIGEPDTLIAATAIRFGLTLVTANTRHFEKVVGLSLRGFAPGAVGSPGEERG